MLGVGEMFKKLYIFPLAVLVALWVTLYRVQFIVEQALRCREIVWKHSETRRVPPRNLDAIMRDNREADRVSSKRYTLAANC